MYSNPFVTDVRHHFAFLFDTYGFEMVHVEVQDHHPDYVMVGLESPDSRIAIDKEWDAVTAMIGSRTADFDCAFKQEGLYQWFNMERLADMLAQRAFRWPSTAETVPSETMMEYLASRIEPQLTEMVALVQQENLEALTTHFKAYAREQIAMRHGRDAP